MIEFWIAFHGGWGGRRWASSRQFYQTLQFTYSTSPQSACSEVGHRVAHEDSDFMNDLIYSWIHHLIGFMWRALILKQALSAPWPPKESSFPLQPYHRPDTNKKWWRTGTLCQIHFCCFFSLVSARRFVTMAHWHKKVAQHTLWRNDWIWRSDGTWEGVPRSFGWHVWFAVSFSVTWD